MTLLDRYLTRAVVVPAATAFLVVAFIVVANEFKVQISSEAIAFLTARDIFILGGALLPSLLPVILPAALYFGVLMGYGRLAERGEITAMRTAGVSLMRIIMPALGLGVIAVIATIVLQDSLLPRTMSYARHLTRVELPRRATLDKISPGVMHPFGDARVYFKEHDPDPQILRDVVVVQQQQGEGPVVYHAKSAKVSMDESGPSLLLGEGYWVSPDGLTGDGDSVLLRLPLPVDTVASNTPLKTSSLASLIEQEKSMSEQLAREPSRSIEKRLRQARRLIAERISMPFASLWFVGIGAAMAVNSSRYRRGGRQRLLATGLIPIFVYYFLSVALMSESLRSLQMALIIGWIPNVVLAAVAVGFFIRTARAH